MSEIRYDQILNIKTLGKREWNNSEINFNRYEATPYQALLELLKHYPIDENDKIIDFGCGRGRVLFYLNYLTNSSGIGIEINELTYQEALENRNRYYQKHPQQQKLEFFHLLAEEYEINKDDNIFYFFNPFSHRIFKKVLVNIENSYVLNPRKIDLILFYPIDDVIKLIENTTIFKFFKEIKYNITLDKNERFIIYRID